MENNLTAEEKNLLQSIVTDKFSVGAFSGMIYNDISKNDDQSDDKIFMQVKLALRIRLLLYEMYNWEVQK